MHPRTFVCLLSVAEASQTSLAFSQPRHYANVLIYFEVNIGMDIHTDGKAPSHLIFFLHSLNL